MKILVIGGAGFLGSNLVRFCLEQPGATVTVMDSLEPQLHATTSHLRSVWSRIRFVRGSLLDDAQLAEVVQEQDVIFNCAAQTSHPLSIQDPLFDAEINCLGNLKLLENIRLLNRNAVVVYTSSSTVIGKATEELVDESHGEKPLEIYSANKGVAEKYYRIYHRVHDLKTVVLRFANLFGPYGKGRPEYGFINYFIHLARAREEISIFGEGGQSRNALYVEDAVAALWTAAHAPQLRGETFFAVHDEHHTVREIATEVVRAMGGGTVAHVPWPDERRRIEIDRVRISAAKFCGLTGWRPRFGLAAGLSRTCEILDTPNA
jgi:nucleoside-diphosphate-sugar epimerase